MIKLNDSISYEIKSMKRKHNKAVNRAIINAMTSNTNQDTAGMMSSYEDFLDQVSELVIVYENDELVEFDELDNDVCIEIAEDFLAQINKGKTDTSKSGME